MHVLNLPSWILDGSRMLHRFETIDPVATALLVVDLQNAFVAEGAQFATAHTRDILPNVNRLVRALRAAGGTILFLRHTVSEVAPLKTAQWHRDCPAVELGGLLLQPGLVDHEVHNGVDRLQGDLVVDKYRYSAFASHSSDVQSRLRERAIDTLIVCGALTNCCCESTARDGSMLGYRVTMVTDATAALTDEEHNAALLNFGANFGDLRATDEVCAMIAAGRQGGG